MMKKICLFLGLLCCLLPLQGQEEVTLEAARKALARALQLRNADSLAAAYCHLGGYYAYRNADSARYYCIEGLKHVRRDEPEPYLILLNNLAETYNADGNMQEAIRLFRRADGEAVRLQYDVSFRVSVLSSLGVCYRRSELPDSALVCYRQALRLLQGHDAPSEEVYLLTNIAILYANIRRLDEAEAYARRAMTVVPRCDDWDMVIYAGSTIGVILSLQGKHDEAARMIHPVLDLARRQQKPRFALKAITYLMNAFKQANRMDSIRHYMREAETWLAKMPEHSTEALGYQEFLYQLLMEVGQYRESLAIQQRLQAVRSDNAQVPADRFYLHMARNYAGLHDYPRATDCYEKAYRMADSLHAASIETELSELSAKYKSQEQELEIVRLNEANLQQKARVMQWGITAIVAMFVLLTGGVWFIFRRKRIRKEAELKLAQSYIDGLERERTRLAKDLHDGVCNDLLAIGMQMQCMPEADTSRSRLLELIEQVRQDVRNISHELMPPKFTHVTLAETVASYVELLSVPASITLSFSEESNGLSWSRVPERVAYEVYRVVQELLSNIVQHAAKVSSIDVRLSLQADEVVLSIEGIGGPCLDAVKTGTGVGLLTLRERAKAVGGTLKTCFDNERQYFEFRVPLLD